MNLYDAVVGIYENEILLLERREQGDSDVVISTRIPMEDVDSLYMHTCLLSGTLILHTEAKNVEIGFNTVSEDIVQRAISLIRRLKPGTSRVKSHGLPALEYSLKTMEPCYVNAVNKFREEEEKFTLAAYQPSLKYRIPREFDWAPLKLLGLTEPVQSGFVVLAHPEELVIIHRTYYTSRPSSECYAFSYHYLPLASLNEMSRCSTGGPYPGLKLDTGLTAPVFPFDPDNQSLKDLQMCFS
jgi:hypothetical protein